MILNISSWLKMDLSSTPLIQRKIILFWDIKWENKEKQIIERATLAKITTLSVSIKHFFHYKRLCVTSLHVGGAQSRGLLCKIHSTPVALMHYFDQNL